MIGLTLGVTGGAAFPGLLAALCMHQFFEGFAIGSTAVDAGLRPGQAAGMGAAYAATTPAGMVAGERAEQRPPSPCYPTWPACCAFRLPCRTQPGSVKPSSARPALPLAPRGHALPPPSCAGILLRESLDQGAPAARLAAGICDAVSAGVLLYVALAELLPAMTASSWLRSRRWPLQVRLGGTGWRASGPRVLA